MQNSLPLNWCECKLETVCALDNGLKQNDLNLPLLDAKYLRGKKEAEYRQDGVVLNPKDYVILVDGENSGEIFSIHQIGIMGSTFKKLNFSDSCSVPYVLFFIKSKQDLFRTNKKGAAIPHLDKTLFKNLQLPLPPLAEQERIVEKIEALFTGIDEGVERLKSTHAQIKQYRQSVLKSAFDSKKLNIQKSLGDIIRIKSGDGLSSKNMDKNGEYPVFGGNGINGHHSTYNVSEQTIVIGRVGFYCGSVHITPNRAWITDNAFRVSFDVQKYDLKFIFWLLKNLNLNKYSVSTAQPVISGTKIYPIFTNVSEDKLEQQRIVEEIEKRFAVADKLEKAVNEGLEKADKLKQSILKKAFSGQLVPQDPNDEPASIILERIKKEKQPQSKGKKKC